MKKATLFRIVILLLTLVMSVGILAGCGGSGSETPVNGDELAVRFMVTSDLHFRVNETNDMQSPEVLAQLLKGTYKYVDAQEGKQLDAMFVAGDFVHGNSSATYDLYKEASAAFKQVNAGLREGTQFIAITGNHELLNVKDNFSEAAAKWKEASGYSDINHHVVIGGYHFIAFCQDINNSGTFGAKYTDATQQWLKDALAEAAADDPTGEKPIFVFQHFPATGTLFDASSSGGSQEIAAILKQYPQVVDFSGHTHRAALHPGSVWQGDYTAINCGSLEMSGAPINSHPTRPVVKITDFDGSWTVTNNRYGMRDGTIIYMVEVNKNHEITLKLYNIFTDKVDRVIKLGKVGNKENFTFDYDSRKAAAAAPTWASDAALLLTETHQNYVRIRIPQAQIGADDLVTTYRCEVYKGNVLVNTVYRLSGTYMGSSAANAISAPLDALEPGTEYTVKVIPVSAWDKEGEALTLNFTTAAETALPAPDILNAQFGANNSGINAVDGKELGKHDNVITEFIPELNKYAASTSLTAYKFDLTSSLPLMANGFSFEIQFRMERMPGSHWYIAACVSDGGFGLNVDSTGKMTYTLYDGGGTRKVVVEGAIAAQEWYHLVGVYDEANDVTTVYLNGTAIGSVASPGGEESTFRVPQHDAKFLCIGGNSSINGGNSYVSRLSHGDIAVCNLYSEALTANEVAALYANLNK